MHDDGGLRYNAERYTEAPPGHDIDHQGWRQMTADRAVSSSDRHGGGALLHV
jgi:hypothetical protein